MTADFLFNLSLSAERENVTNREHSFNTIPCGVMLSTTNFLPVRTISMMVPMVMCSIGFIALNINVTLSTTKSPPLFQGGAFGVVGF